MDYYYKEFEKLQDEFHEVIHHFPLFQEMIDDIFDKDIKEINELLEKNDEFYLKKAISKLEDLIKYIKDTSTSIDSEYQKFDKLAKIWENKTINVSSDVLDKLNDKIKRSNSLIQSHNLKDLKEANKLLEEVLKYVK